MDSLKAVGLDEVTAWTETRNLYCLAPPPRPAEIRHLADGPLNHTQDRPRQLAGENLGNFVIAYHVVL